MTPPAAAVRMKSRRDSLRSITGLGLVSETISSLGEIVRQQERHSPRLAQVDNVPSDEVSQIIRIDTSCEIVSRRYRAERARIVGESGSIVDPGRLGGFAPEAHHAFDGVVEPPRRAEEDCRVVARDWSELAAIRGFVEREEYQPKSCVVSIRVQQLPQIARELRCDRNVAAAIRPVLLVIKLVVIAQGAGMKLHDESVLRRKRCHLHQHVRLEPRLIVSIGFYFERT